MFYIRKIPSQVAAYLRGNYNFYIDSQLVTLKLRNFAQNHTRQIELINTHQQRWKASKILPK